MFRKHSPHLLVVMLGWLVLGIVPASAQTQTGTTLPSTVQVTATNTAATATDSQANDPEDSFVSAASNDGTTKYPDLAGSNQKTALENYGWGPLSTIDDTLGYLPPDWIRHGEKFLPNWKWGSAIRHKQASNGFLQWAQDNQFWRRLGDAVLLFIAPAHQLYVDFRPLFVSLGAFALMLMWLSKKNGEMHRAFWCMLGIMFLGSIFFQETDFVVHGLVKLPATAVQEFAVRFGSSNLQVDDAALASTATFSGDPGRNAARIWYNRDFLYNGVYPYCRITFGDLNFAFKIVPDRPGNPNPAFHGLTFCEYDIKAKATHNKEEWNYLKDEVKANSKSAWGVFQGHDQADRANAISSSLPAIWGHVVLDYLAGFSIIVAVIIYLFYAALLGFYLLGGIVPWWRQAALNAMMTMADMLWRWFSIFALITLVHVMSGAIYPMADEIGWEAMEGFQFALVVVAIAFFVMRRLRKRSIQAVSRKRFNIDGDEVGSKAGDYEGAAIRAGALAMSAMVAPEAALAVASTSQGNSDNVASAMVLPSIATPAIGQGLDSTRGKSMVIPVESHTASIATALEGSSQAPLAALNPGR